MSNDYLKKILTARVYDVAQETPLELANTLSQRIDNRIYFKREDMQSVFSFKLRGAYNKMAHLTPAQLKRGVICASAGNHAQGVALSAARLGCRAVIVMPTTTPQVKIDAVKARGGEVVLFGDSFTDAYEHALTLEKKQKLTFVHPFDDPYVIAGQGTVGMEILRQHPDPIHAIFVAIGGGGLIAGVASYVKAVRPDIKIIGVQTTDSDAMARSLKAGRRVALPDVGLFSDGTAVKLVGEETFRIAKELVDIGSVHDVLVLSDDPETAEATYYPVLGDDLENAALFCEQNLSAIFERQTSARKKNKLRSMLLIVDDVSGVEKSATLEMLFKRGRHMGIQVMLLNQMANKSMATWAKANSSFILFSMLPPTGMKDLHVSMTLVPPMQPKALSDWAAANVGGAQGTPTRYVFGVYERDYQAIYKVKK
jgi:threonine dehydratase